MMLIIFLYYFWEELGEKWRSNGAGNGGGIKCGASAMIRCIGMEVGRELKSWK